MIMRQLENMERQIKYKTCDQCRRCLPIVSFYRNNQRKDGRQSLCSDCMKQRRKERRYDQKYNQTLKAKANAKRYAQSEKGKLRKQIYQAIWVSQNRERLQELWKKYNKMERYKAIQKKYWETEKGKKAKAKKDANYRLTPNGRMAKKRIEKKRKYALKDSTLTLAEWEQIKEKHNHLCFYCKKKKPLEMDHFIPLSRGGQHTKENVVPSCRSCNAKKSNRLVEI